MRSAVLIAIMLVLVFCLPLAGQTVKAEDTKTYHWTQHIPNHDAYVWSSTGDVNYGSQTSLMVEGNDKRTFMSWNLTGITPGATIEEVQIYIYGGFNYYNPGVDYLKIMPVSAWWNESTITWNNKPAMIYESDPILTFMVEGAGAWYNATSAEFTSTVAAQYASTGRVSIGFNQSYIGMHKCTFDSSESSTDGGYYRPSLWIYWYTTTPPPHTWTYKIEPVADAEVRESNPNDNYGDWESLSVKSANVGGAKQSYLRWNLSGLPYMANMTEVRLILYKVLDDTGSGKLTLLSYYPAQDWAEDELTWQNRPTSGVQEILSFDDAAEVEHNGWVAAAGPMLTNVVQDQYNASESAYLYLSDDSWYAVGNKMYYSKESTIGYHPYLEITFWTEETDQDQPGTGTYEPGSFWTRSGLKNWVLTVMGIIGFLGMVIALPLVVIWLRSGEYDNPVFAIANGAAIWTVSFVFFWGSLAI